MQIYPAIDIKNGQCVRLKQGDFSEVTVFNDDPEVVAKDWAKCGAAYIHVVDLDGARMGSAFNNDAIKRIVSAAGVPVQVGGGIRTMRDIEDKIGMGVERVILGTAAIKDPAFVKEAVRIYKGKIAVGIDAKDGLVATHGWEQKSNIRALALCHDMVKIGVQTIIYTDISKDGMMSGPNLPATKEIIDAVKINIIASGGVSCMKDLENLKEIGASGAIVGKALYQGALNLREVIICMQKE